MAKKFTIAVITEKLTELMEVQGSVAYALQEEGLIIDRIIEREKLKDGKWVTWFSVEKCEKIWCNVCGEHVTSFRTRCVKCGARLSA